MFFDHSSKRWIYEYPLVEWKWDRGACVEAIKGAGLNVPPKSSCFFCPSMRKTEILEMSRTHPELMKRAIEMEDNAVTTTVNGLGRRFAWGEFLRADSRQGRLFGEQPEIPCSCFDGSDPIAIGEAVTQ
jgi:hypothetical protein